MLAAILVLIPFPTGRAQEAPKAKAAELAPEMAKMAFLIGEWHYTQKYEKSAMMPEGGEGVGTYRAAIGPGGHSIVTDFEETAGPLAGIGGHEVFTWDAEKKAYVGYTFASSGPGAFVRYGSWEGEQLVFTREIVGKKGTVRMRYVYTETKADALTIETSVGIGDGPMALAFITKAKK